jgi:ABC-2 type transport system ATP-binding protein
MIKVQHLQKKYRRKFAVDDLSFTVKPGKVTGFLGPNGAGKSTTMRIMLGLDHGGGTVLFDGKPLSSFHQPARTVGFLLEAKAFHPKRTARNHLRILAAASDIAEQRVDEVLELVGLEDVASQRPGGFSLGMSQRLGIAAAILGEPKYLLLDEPANGLDPEGIAWLRHFVKDYAARDNGVFISSHLLGEMAQIADNIVVIGKGKLIADSPIEKLLAKQGAASVFVRTTNPRALKKILREATLGFQESGGGLIVAGATTEEIGRMAAGAKVTLLELSTRTATLEDAFLEITEDAEEYRAGKGDA